MDEESVGNDAVEQIIGFATACPQSMGLCNGYKISMLLLDCGNRLGFPLCLIVPKAQTL